MEYKKKRNAAIIELLHNGVSVKKIADLYGISEQRVRQLNSQNPKWTCCRKMTYENCVFPNLRTWMTENNVSRLEFVRKMNIAGKPEYYAMRLGKFLRNEEDPKKWFIDKMLEVTGMTYEQMFSRG